MPWWLNNNLRLIQNNLRDIDAAMDVDALIGELQEYSCNVAMVGAGGISSFFPSRLPFQRPSAWLNGRDTLGEIVAKCHAKGIRVIARFDFSKIHESLFPEHPEWCYESADGRYVHYNDTVHTCINGEYQQQKSLEIIREVLANYPVDGIFFNMFGFTTRDYSGNDYGICHCEPCKKRFLDFSGLDLPPAGQPSVPAWARYIEFKEMVVGDILEKIHHLTREFGPEIAVCTYHHKYVDIIRNESNSAVDRPYPFWLYHSSLNVARVRTNWDDKIVSNCVINAVDIPYRFMGVSKELTSIRLYENMAEGSGLDFCIIGVFEDYPDRASLASVRKIYRFHKENEPVFRHMQSQAKLAVILPTGFHPVMDGTKNLLGVFKALKEEHIPFDLLGIDKVLAEPEALDRYSAVILTDMPGLPAAVIQAIVDRGVFVILTGVTRVLEPAIAEMLGVQIAETLIGTRAAYLATREKDIFRHFADRDWIILDREFGMLDAPSYRSLLPLVSPAWFGPPERCFGHEVTSHGGVLLSGERRCAVIPWHLGELYYQYGYEDHKWVLSDLLDAVAPQVRVIRTDAPPCVEIFWNRCESEGEYLLQLINLSGFNGTTVAAPLPIRDITVTLPLAADVAGCAVSLRGNPVTADRSQALVRLVIPELKDYEAIVIRP